MRERNVVAQQLTMNKVYIYFEMRGVGRSSSLKQLQFIKIANTCGGLLNQYIPVTTSYMIHASRLQNLK